VIDAASVHDRPLELPYRARSGPYMGFVDVAGGGWQGFLRGGDRTHRRREEDESADYLGLGDLEDQARFVVSSAEEKKGK